MRLLKVPDDGLFRNLNKVAFINGDSSTKSAFQEYSSSSRHEQCSSSTRSTGPKEFELSSTIRLQRFPRLNRLV